MFGSRLSRQRLTVDLFTPATFAMVVVPISAIRLCNQLSILRASVLLRAVELSICDTSSGVVWNGRQSGGFRLADFPDLRSSKLAARSESDFFCVIGLVGVVRSRQASVGNPLVNCARRATTGFSYNRNANLFDDFAKTVRCHV
nr:MAG TPA: hypothetical protein [Bacteriophage sp.]